MLELFICISTILTSLSFAWQWKNEGWDDNTEWTRVSLTNEHNED